MNIHVDKFHFFSLFTDLNAIHIWVVSCYSCTLLVLAHYFKVDAHYLLTCVKLFDALTISHGNGS